MIVVEIVADGRPGGGTTHVLQLTGAIRAGLGAEVHLITQVGSPALEEGRRLGARVHGIDFFAARLDPRVWWQLRKLLREIGPDLVHAHGARAGLPIARAKGRTRLLYTVHGYHFLHKPRGVRQLAWLAERACSARADVTVFVSAHDRDVAACHGILARCRGHRVIPNGIDTAGLPQATAAAPHRLGFLGRLAPPKNPLFLLDILDRLRDGPHRLLVIGNGELMPAMRARAEALGLADRVDFRGSLPRAEAVAELARIGVLVLPSLWEGLPIAALEAMAVGVPVVASAVGGIPEIIEHERTGLLIEQRDPELYARAIRRLADGEFRARLVAQAREAVSTRFSWAVAERAYLDLYRAALAPG